jgi:DNA mismatch endonuclease Vsr
VDHLTPAARTELMSRIKSRDTRPELMVRSIIHRLGYRFRLHRKDLPGTPDLVFPSRHKVIFVHGCFWHGHTCKRGKRPTTNATFWGDKISQNRKRDRRVATLLTNEGWQVMAVWQCEISDSDLPTRIKRFLGR